MISAQFFRLLTDMGAIDPVHFQRMINKRRREIADYYPAISGEADKAVARSQLTGAQEREVAARVEFDKAKHKVVAQRQLIGDIDRQTTDTAALLRENIETLALAQTTLQAARGAVQDAQLEGKDTAEAQSILQQWRQEAERLQGVADQLNTQVAQLAEQRSAAEQDASALDVAEIQAENVWRQRKGDVAQLTHSQVPLPVQEPQPLANVVNW